MPGLKPTSSTRRRTRHALIVAALLAGPAVLSPCAAHAQSQPQPQPQPQPTATEPVESRYEQAMRLQSRAFAAISASAYDEALAALTSQLELQPTNFVVHYNLACVHARLGDPESSLGSLERAIELGFIDHHQLTTDPDLDAIRTNPRYQALLEGWPRIIKARAEANLERTKEIYGDSYLYTSDDERRLLFATAYDQTSLDIARAELTALWEWGIAEIFHDLRNTTFEDPWVTVVLPSRQDFNRWAMLTYGPTSRTGLSGIGGAYDHDRKQLIAQDLGGTLRHEFFHVLHWRSNARQGQLHPIWIQEGLCSLVEDYDLVNGTVVPVPSWRTNTVKRLANAGRLTPIEELAAIERDRFTAGGRTMARYAEARTFFLYLYSKGLVGTWYQLYCETYEEDPSGLASILRVLDTDLKSLNDDYRQWVRALPLVPEPGAREGRVGLGINIDPGSGDGPVVTEIESRAARAAGVRIGDVLYAVEGRPTRDPFELVRVLGSYEPGHPVTLSLRRGSRHLTAQLQLIDLRATP